MTPFVAARIAASALDIATRYADAREVEEALFASYLSAKAQRESVESEWRAMTAPDWKGKP